MNKDSATIQNRIYLLEEKIKYIELHLVNAKHELWQLREDFMDHEERKLDLIPFGSWSK